MTERSSFGEDFLFDESSVSFDSSPSLFGSGMVLGNMRTRMETTRAREPKSWGALDWGPSRSRRECQKGWN